MPTRLSLALVFVCGLAVTGPAAPPPAPPAAKAEDEKLTKKQEDEKLLKEHKLATEGPALLDYFKKRTLDDKALDSAGGLVKQLGDSDYFVREKATESLRKIGPGIVPLLRRALLEPDEEVKDRAQTLILALEAKTHPDVTQAAVRLLRAKPPAEAVPVLLNYLPAAENDAVEDEVLNSLAILGVKDGKVDKLFDEALKDRNPTRRAAAGLALGRSGTAEQKKAAQALLTDGDVTVRFRAAQGLLAGHERAGVPVLCALVGEGPMPIGSRAEELLQCLAGGQPPRTPPFTDDDKLRKRARQIWEDWWKQNGKMDLAKADVDLPPFNTSLKAREVIHQYGAALMVNDLEGMKKTVGWPFLAYGNQQMNTKEDAERYVEGNNLPGRGQQGTLVIQGMVGMDTYLTKGQNIQPNEKGFLQDAKKKGDVRLFNVYIQYNPQFNPGQGEEFTLFLRTTGDQVKIIGFGQPRGRNVLEKW
jgi:hypothetical protein